MKNYLSVMTILLALLLSGISHAQDVRVSLLTCSPSGEVYAQYGHTALRVQRQSDSLDYAFNYGVFSFDQPNFMWRFVLGKCDYMLMPVPWRYFESEYRERGSSVTQQELNLTNEEATRLLTLLIDESQPQNCQYRYDFIRNNCTTKVRDIIERVLTDSVVYPPLEQYEGVTYRRMLHCFNDVEPWSQEGCDILLGADVDTILSRRATMFLPYSMMRYADGAVIRDSMNNSRPLVRATYEVVPLGSQHVESPLPYSPACCAWALVGVFLLVVALEYALHYQLWIIDFLLMTLQGCSGLLLLFMMLVSAHPGVHQNWLILLLHPFALFGAYKVVKNAVKRSRTWWHPFNFAILIIFLVFSRWMPQDFGIIIIPLCLILLTRPVSYLLYYRKED